MNEAMPSPLPRLLRSINTSLASTTAINTAPTNHRPRWPRREPSTQAITPRMLHATVRLVCARLVPMSDAPHDSPPQ
jgi:hypothetical protein